MSLRILVGAVSAAAIGGLTIYGMGCSSSSAPAQATQDSGAHAGADAGIDADTGTLVQDSGRPTDATAPADSGAGGDSGDVDCPPATASFTATTYVPAVAHQGLCSSASIATFVGDCDDNGTTQTCNAWTAANVAGEGGAGTPCGNCIVAPMNNGAVWFDPGQELNPNVAGCIQIMDPTQAGTIVGSRMKRAGARFSQHGGQTVMLFRAALLSHRFVALHDQLRNTYAARVKDVA